MPLGPTVHHQVCPVIVRLLNFAQKGSLQCKQHTWNRDRMGSKSQKLHHDVVMCRDQAWHTMAEIKKTSHNRDCMDAMGAWHGLWTPGEEIAFTARPKIESQSQIVRYGRSIFCLPHRPKFSDLCLHRVSVVHGKNDACQNWDSKWF